MNTLHAADSTIVIQRRRHRGGEFESRAASTRVVVACSLLLLLVAATLLVSARTAIGPMLQSAAEARAGRETGAIVYALPDGIFCRHLTFDNLTAEIKEGDMRRCRDDVSRIRLRPRRDFASGPH